MRRACCRAQMNSLIAIPANSPDAGLYSYSSGSTSGSRWAGRTGSTESAGSRGSRRGGGGAGGEPGGGGGVGRGVSRRPRLRGTGPLLGDPAVLQRRRPVLGGVAGRRDSEVRQP